MGEFRSGEEGSILNREMTICKTLAVGVDIYRAVGLQLGKKYKKGVGQEERATPFRSFRLLEELGLHL